MANPYFPMFINLHDKKVVVIGGGKIAYRRVMTLLKFGADITVIALSFCEDLVNLCSDRINLLNRSYGIGDCSEAILVVAATDNREVNHSIYKECDANNIMVSVADCKEECSFFFPGVVVAEDVVIGVTASGKDHKLAKDIRKNIEVNLDIITKGRDYEKNN